MASQQKSTYYAQDGGGVDNPWYVYPSTGLYTVGDGNYPMVDMGGTAPYGIYSNYLSGVQCSFSIPTGSTINGIYFQFYGWSSYYAYGKRCSPFHVNLLKGSSIYGSDRCTNQYDDWTTSPAWKSYGGSADLWGGSWTPADINGSGFGGAMSAWNYDQTTVNTVCIDQYLLTVYYTVAGVKFCAVLCSKFDGVTFSKFDGVA